MTKIQNTNPYHEMMRYEWLMWFHRGFTNEFKRYYFSRHTTPPSISKTMKACKYQGYLIGLQPIIIRFITYITLHSKYSDPILPFSNCEPDNDLMNELINECGLYPEDALTFYKNITVMMNVANSNCTSILSKLSYTGSVDVNRVNNTVEISCTSTKQLKDTLKKVRMSNICTDKSNYMLYGNKLDYTAKVVLNYTHYMKLSILYEKHTPSKEDCHTKIFTLVARYEIYSGNTSGMQGAVPPYVLNKLNSILDIDTECFASPLNCHIDFKYNSAFYDTDKYFGSKGSFFKNNYASINVQENGRYEVNPPFINSIMNLTASLIHNALSGHNKLLFFVIVPSWTDAEYYTSFMHSKYLKCHDTLEAKEHEFIDGLQHRSVRTAWKANVSSTWFLLSTGITIPENIKNQINNAFRIPM